MRSPEQRRAPALLPFLSAVTAAQRRAERCGGAVGRAGRVLLPHLPSSQPLSAPGFKVGSGVTTAMAELASFLWLT